MSGSTGYISLSADVSVVPSVIAAGGSDFALNGLLVSNNTRTPIGSVLSFPNLLAVQAYYGTSSTEAAMAAIYFAGFLNSPKKPAAYLIAQYPWTAPVAAWLRGGNISGITLAQLQAITGSLTVTIDGTTKTAASLNLSSATSFSSAATLIGTALGLSGGQAVTFDSLSGGLTITSGTTGTGSSLTYATGTAALALGLDVTSGTLSQGAAIATPVAAMNAIYAITAGWFSFTTTFEPVLADKIAFANWNNQQAGNTAYVMWDSTAAQAVSVGTGYAYLNILAAGYVGTAPSYLDPLAAAADQGYFASVDFGALNGTTTLKFRNFPGLTPTVTNSTIAANLTANGINYYGVSGDSLNSFTYMRNGVISGAFAWCDAYMNQAYFNRQLKIALIQFLTQVPSVPYSAVGAALIEAAIGSVITAMVNFGAITPGVTLSSAQIAEVNNAAGLPIDATLSARGWYLQVLPGTAAQRAARSSPPCNLWYTFGASVQSIVLASILVQ